MTPHMSSERLSAFLAGELAPSERRAAEAHLLECGACATSRRDLEAMVAALHALPRRAAPADLLDAVRARVAQPSWVDRLRAAWAVLSRPPVLSGLATAAAAVLIIVVTQQREAPRPSLAGSEAGTPSAAPRDESRAPVAGEAPAAKDRRDDGARRAAGLAGEVSALRLRAVEGGSPTPPATAPAAASRPDPGASVLNLEARSGNNDADRLNRESLKSADAEQVAKGASPGPREAPGMFFSMQAQSGADTFNGKEAAKVGEHEAKQRGGEEVEELALVLVASRMEEVRTWLGERAAWSRDAEESMEKNEEQAPLSKDASKPAVPTAQAAGAAARSPVMPPGEYTLMVPEEEVPALLEQLEGWGVVQVSDGKTGKSEGGSGLLGMRNMRNSTADQTLQGGKKIDQKFSGKPQTPQETWRSGGREQADLEKVKMLRQYVPLADHGGKSLRRVRVRILLRAAPEEKPLPKKKM